MFNINLLAANDGLDGSLAQIVEKLKGLMDSFWVYIIIALAAVVVIWGAYIGIKIAIAHRNEEKINARDMVKNLIIGIVIIFVVAMGAPLLINGLSAWVNPNTFMYLPAMIASIALGIALIVAVLNLAKRVYEIIFMYFCMPVSMSTLPLDDGARFKNWREQFVTKIVLAYGTVLSVNIFVLLLPLIQRIYLPGVGGFGNALFLIFMIVGGAMVIPAGQTLFAKLFGAADDMHAGGGWLRSAYYGGRVIGGMTVGLAVKGIRGIRHIVRNNKHSNNDGGSSDSGSSDSADNSGDERYVDDGTTNTADGGEE